MLDEESLKSDDRFWKAMTRHSEVEQAYRERANDDEADGTPQDDAVKRQDQQGTCGGVRATERLTSKNDEEGTRSARKV